MDQGINAVQAILPRCQFDKIKYEHGIEGLHNHRRAWDDKSKVFNDRPLHDWASHPADGFRTGVLAMGSGLRNGGPPKKLNYQAVSIA